MSLRSEQQVVTKWMADSGLTHGQSPGDSGWAPVNIQTETILGRNLGGGRKQVEDKHCPAAVIEK